MQMGLALPLNEIFKVVASRIVGKLVPIPEPMLDNFFDVGRVVDIVGGVLGGSKLRIFFVFILEVALVVTALCDLLRRTAV